MYACVPFACVRLRSDSEGKHCRRGWAELQLGAATKPDHGRYAFFDRFKTQRDTSRPFQTSVNCSALGATGPRS